MTLRILFFALFLPVFSYSQSNEKITTIETVEILNDNADEAIYYFENNWKKLRETAVKKGYIHSFQLLKTAYSEEAPFHIVLITTFANQKQFDDRETHFTELIKASGGLKLLNEKTPAEFRKSVFAVSGAKHLE
jgi:hypothetical protein